MTSADLPTSADTPAPKADAPFMRVIKTYVLRAGRMGPGQTRAFEQYGPKFLQPYQPTLLDTAAAFGRAAPLILEIGFGMGETTAKIAKTLPEKDFLGVEVHTPGVGALLKLIDELSIPNIRIIQHDAVDVLNHMLPDASLDGVHIFFPDPWPKKRHVKRRLITPDFLKLIAPKITPGGFIHVATDWVPYAEFVKKSFSAVTDIFEGGEVERPSWRPVTRFEGQGIEKDHRVTDLRYTKIN